MDKVLVHNAISTLDILVITLISANVFDVVLRGLKDYIFIHTTNRIDMVLGLKVYDHLLRLPLIYFKNRRVGTVITRISQVESIRNFLTSSILVMTIDSIFFIIFIAVMYQFSPILTIILICSFPLYFFVAWIFTPSIIEKIEKQFYASSINTAFLNESLYGIETIKSLGTEPVMKREWENQSESLALTSFNSSVTNNIINQSVSLIQKITSVIVLLKGVDLTMTLELTIGQLIAFNMMVSHVNRPVSHLVDLWQQFIQMRVSVDKLSEMLNTPKENFEDKTSRKTSIEGSICIVGLKFKYQPNSPFTLNGLNIFINQGEHVGIVGPSGSGKSTLTKLIQRLYLPSSGSIYIDDNQLDSIDPMLIRENIGVVLQENYLFNRTVRQNIALKNSVTSLSEVIEVAKLAGAHDFIVKLPLGYDTLISEAGSSLSGGQKQRIAIARALIGNPKILIFDEATSALDDESQSIIKNNMSKIIKGRTVITVAHRLSTVKDCDRIITLEEGKVSESGTHSELIKTGGCYSRLWNVQKSVKNEKI
ncbi:peptidase domain-containing ABC transporter [Vibrio splendidus]|uniref:peptidase domain-containing ABC transporter n=1 Tax=Vibrio splendidus TaxID=29497 RepID=UPI0002E2CF2A|nr:ABC transporter transmembrane domain-containing protein [Vibrio splendidus]